MSFRLGGSDGVSIVTRRWQTAFTELGWRTLTVAGAGKVDRFVDGLDIDWAPEPDSGTMAERGKASPRLVDDLAEALSDIDLVVVENLLTIPLNLPASRCVAEVLAGRPAIMHHHDPPWQRDRFAHITELPVDDPAWCHVTINRLTQTQMAERRIRATTIYNGFPVEPPGAREPVRTALGVAPNELLLAHPVRAIPRKNIPTAIEIAERLGATYWLLGPAEEGYDDELARVLAAARCRVIHRPWTNIADLYAASDGVVFPSLVEGFGNPPIEAALHRRGVVVGHYPVAEELRALGFEWFDQDRPDDFARFVQSPDKELLDHNRDLAVRHFSLERMTDHIRDLLIGAGWWHER